MVLKSLAVENNNCNTRIAASESCPNERLRYILPCLISNKKRRCPHVKSATQGFIVLIKNVYTVLSEYNHNNPDLSAVNSLL